MSASTLKHRQPLAVAVALALAVGSAHAAVISVNDAGDSGTNCTLRQAIEAANTDAVAGGCTAGAGADTITFAGILSGSTITLAGNSLDVTSNISIQGSGQTIDAAGNSGVFNAYSATLSVSSLTLTGGAAQNGGGIQASFSSVTLADTTVRGNAADYNGGGIYTYSSTLELLRSTVSGNSALSSQPYNAGIGGGIAAKYDSTVTLTNSTVSGNTATTNAGGIFLGPSSGGEPKASLPGKSAHVAQGSYDGGTLTLNNSTVSGNQATTSGGGVYTREATVSITDSAIINNRVTTAQNYAGGGLYFDNSHVTLTSSTVSGNSATGTGGAYYITGGLYAWNSPVSLINCTIANNTASGSEAIGGGLSESHSSSYVGSGLSLTNTTVSGNVANATGGTGAGGLLLGFESRYSNASLQNTIVSGNTGTTNNDIATYTGPSASITVTARFSLLGSSLSGTIGGTGNQYSDNPGLGILTGNGGPTQTMLPQTGSPAIDKGSNALAVDPSSQPLAFDQRGSGYARITGNAVDVGAVEFGSGAITPPVAYMAVPTLSNWAAALLASLLGLGAWLIGRRRRDVVPKRT